jgi:hypothetical protein
MIVAHAKACRRREMAMTTPTRGKPAVERDEGRSRRVARRGLLRGLAAGSAGVVLGAEAAAAESAQSPADEASAGGDHRRLGFRPTDHTRWFYHRARW